MRQIGMIGVVLFESKHEDLHPGKSETIHDLFYVRGYHTEIFSHQRKVWEMHCESIEKILPRAFHPLSVDCCLLMPAGISQ